MVRSYFEICRKSVLDFARRSNYNDQYEKLFEFEKVRISFEKKAFDYY
jgi:ATP-dependent protease Clp ATPase subunit